METVDVNKPESVACWTRREDGAYELRQNGFQLGLVVPNTGQLEETDGKRDGKWIAAAPYASRITSDGVPTIGRTMYHDDLQVCVQWIEDVSRIGVLQANEVGREVFEFTLDDMPVLTEKQSRVLAKRATAAAKIIFEWAFPKMTAAK